MKSLAFTLSILPLVVTTMAAEPTPLTIAVFDFQSDESARELGPKFSALVAADLSSDARLITVERAELDKALGEQELALSGTISADTAAKVGHLTGAQVLVTGRMIKADRETLAVAKVISTDTSRVFGAKAALPASGALADGAQTLATSIGDIVEKNAAVLVAKAESTEERIARIKAGLKPGARPTISVHIPEQHFGQPVIDPAAETELSYILQQCGFAIFDKGSTGRADFAIEGEAFSERALQKGNLISCKARVEVKLRNLGNGQVVAVDRQVSRAVDLAEHVAAKAALANAARELAERLVPLAAH